MSVGKVCRDAERARGKGTTYGLARHRIYTLNTKLREGGVSAGKVCIEAERARGRQREREGDESVREVCRDQPFAARYERWERAREGVGGRRCAAQGEVFSASIVNFYCCQLLPPGKTQLSSLELSDTNVYEP